MSKLEELIKEFCPNGVEYKKIEELCAITTGKLNANAMVENGEYAFFTCDAKPFRIDTYAFDMEAILISGNGSQVGHINYYKGKFNAYQRTYVLYDFQFIEVKFLLYCLEIRLRKYIFLKSKKGSVPYITLPMLQEFKVPLPALPVQREIVRVLDNFTLYSDELKNKLNEELTARRKQYEFYRDKILNFNQQEVEVKKLSDIFNTRNGYTPSTSNKEYWATNDVPWFRVEDIRSNGRILNDSIQHVSFSAIKGKVFPANSIIISTSATIGEHALITCESIANQRFTYLMLKDQYKDKYNIKYLFYYCFLLADFCRENLQQGSFASVDMSKFNKFEFPMPPIEVQERIVKVMDNFDAICSDLWIGLPAEIEKRQKQYEYYREKLLTFDGKYATILTERNGTERAGLIRLLQYVYGFVNVPIQSYFTRLKGTPITAEKMKQIATVGGEIKIFAGGKTVIDANEKDIPNANITRVPAVLVQSRGVIDFIYYDKPFTFKNEMWAYTCSNLVTLKYLFYYLKNNVKYFRENASGMGALPQISLGVTDNFVIPLPTLEKQKEIVEILDKFDSLCNDLTAGLPAEIEHRQKQYEYYRDKLLSF